MRITLISGVIIFIAALTGCDGSSSNANNTDASSVGVLSNGASSSAAYQYQGAIQSPLAITSAITGITYPYHVYLPYGYDQSNKNYPIIYCTDAQWYFFNFTKMIDTKHKDVIFIGIEEGPLKSDRRYIDFVSPGATNYINFFKNEFVPMIENNYRSNHERTFVGTSYGGLLGGIFLSKEPVDAAYFKNYMLFDSTFDELKSSNIEDEEKRFSASKALNLTIILTSANVEPGNWASVDTFQRRYENRQYEGLKIIRRAYTLNHFDIPNPSFNDALDLVFASVEHPSALNP